MAKTLSYADAARLLGGGDSRLVTAIDNVAGGLLLATVPAFPAVLGLFDAKAEFARLGRDLVRGAAEKRSGLSRHGRTRRIEAAHSVLVVTAFFEEMAEADLPFRFADLELTRAEQESLAAGGSGAAAQALAGDGLAHPVPLPSPHQPDAEFRRRLRAYYRGLSASTLSFVQGLAAVDRLPAQAQERTAEILDDLPARSVERYDGLFRQLAADFPEVALWSAQRHHAVVSELAAAMSGMQRLLTDISTGRLPDGRRDALAGAYRAALERPIVESSDAPPGLRIPTLAEVYVQPLFRVARVQPGVPPSDEQWWSARAVRSDMDEFLTGHLTSPEAVVAPLLILGQPGSGKSVLTKVLAARLPAADFLPIRVVLREVQADAELQDQIEYAVRAATGERVEWPALVRSGPDTLPVVILDGFDELLQATGVSQTDYLIRIARFQQREADQGRPLAVLITSRTSVADRARAPEETVALRLEPFDDARVEAWLRVWNAANASWLTGRDLAPLPAPTVLRHRDLAGQPLLLLMLALYDADGNALQRLTGDLGQGELYSRLLRNFATREVTKHRPGLDDRGLTRAIDEELHRLAVVGLAMFNRGTQWITEPELEADLAALLVPSSPMSRSDLRAPLTAAEKALGRFFFIHHSQASRDGADLRTYEFLHATFGEYLVAWIVWRALREIAAREAVSEFSLSAAPADDDRLHALLSFAPLSNRLPILTFLAESTASLTPEQRAPLTDLVIRLFRAAHLPRSARMYEAYQPRHQSVPARHAAYSANLVLLATCLSGVLTARELLGPVTDPVGDWHQEVLLWRSQLTSDEWSGISKVLDLERTWEGEERGFRLSLARGEVSPPPVDPAWTYGLPYTDGRRDVYAQHGAPQLIRKEYLQCGNLDDVLMHTVEPLFDRLGEAVNLYLGFPRTGYVSAAHLLMRVWTLPLLDLTEDDRRDAYLHCMDAAPYLTTDVQADYLRLIFDRLATDTAATIETALVILRRYDGMLVSNAGSTDPRAVAGCGLAFLMRTEADGPDDESGLAATLSLLLPEPSIDDPEVVARAWVLLAERGITVAWRRNHPGWDAFPELTDRWRKAVPSARSAQVREVS
ncbi:NACHT domain-containing protein [Actinoplanes sp. CA-054009]